jgi:PEGA domain
MNKKFVFLSLLLLLGLFFTSCKRNNNNPVTTNLVGNIFVKSTPASAQIWLDGINSGKVTPDTLTNVSVGNHAIILKLTHYFNDTVTVNVHEGIQTLDRSLLTDKSIIVYGPIQIWETALTDSTHPSGIILKLGTSSLIVGGINALVDVFYSSNGYVITSAFNLNSRSTSFFVGLSDTLTDGFSSPSVLPTWVTQVLDTVQSYFFLFDSDLHYSKMVIVEKGGVRGSSNNPAWVKVNWLYNNKPNDQRF